MPDTTNEKFEATFMDVNDEDGTLTVAFEAPKGTDDQTLKTKAFEAFQEEYPDRAKDTTEDYLDELVCTSTGRVVWSGGDSP